MGLFNKKKRETDDNCCSNCGAVLEDDSLFCAECGTAIKSAFASDSEAETGNEHKMCPECNTMIDDDSNFCWNCGHIFNTLLNRCAKCNAILPEDAEVCTMCGNPMGKVNHVFEPSLETVPITETVSIPESSPAKTVISTVRSSVRATSDAEIKEEEIKAVKRNFHKPSAL